VKVPRKKVPISEDFDTSKNGENVDSSYVSSTANEHMDCHEALEPETTKEIWADKEEEPINGTVIWDEEEANAAYGMGDTSLFDDCLETIFDRPYGEKTFLDEAVLDHDAIPPFGDCMVSSSEPIGFDEDSMPYPIYDPYDDVGVIVPKYDEGWAFEKLRWDMDPSSQE
jgi:hypothetical protein